MGNFFKALEQAERERALNDHARQRSTAGGDKAPAPVVSGRFGGAAPAVAPSKAPAPPAPVVRPQGKAQDKVPDKAPVPRPAPRPVSTTDASPSTDQHLVSLLSPNSFGAEQYRVLRHRVEQLHATANLSIVGVTSPQEGDGKTITAINLAGALAQAPDTRVLIVDADLRLSSIADYLGLSGGAHSRGLVGAILDQGVSLKSVVEPCPPFNVSVLRAGRRPTTPYELLKSPRLGQLLDEARQEYDYIVVDMPPLLPLLDSRVIGQWVDGLFVVIGAHKTPRKLVAESLKILDPATVIGLIFNGDDQTPGDYYGAAQTGERPRRWGARGRRTDEEGTR